MGIYPLLTSVFTYSLPLKVILGKSVVRPVELDQGTAKEIFQCGVDSGFKPLLGGTMCTDDFYEGKNSDMSCVLFDPPPLHTHTHNTHTHTHTHTHIHTQAKQSLRQPYETQLLPPSEPALGCLCTTQALEPCAGKSSWGRASNPQTCRRTVQVSRREVAKPKVPQQPHLAVMVSCSVLSPSKRLIAGGTNIMVYLKERHHVLIK